MKCTDGDTPRPRSPRWEAAKAAGLSRRQMITALRVSNIPDHIFEELVEGNEPPIVTALARMGTEEMPHLRRGAGSANERSAPLTVAEVQRAVLKLDRREREHLRRWIVALDALREGAGS